MWWIRYAILAGLSIDQIHTLTGIDPWFLANIEELVALEGELRKSRMSWMTLDSTLLGRPNKMAFRIVNLLQLWNTTETEVRRRCRHHGIRPVFKLVDTCAAEFEAVTPYYYSTYEYEDEVSHWQTSS